MRIAIDARLFGPHGAGIGKYSEKLIENLQKIDHENEYSILLRKDNWYLFNPEVSNYEKIMADAPFYSLREQTVIPATFLKIKPDLVHFTHFNVPLLYSGKFVVTIHDIIAKEFSGTKTTTRVLPIYFLKRAGYKLTLRQTVKRASKIIVPSAFVEKKLNENFPSSRGKTTVVYESVDEVFTAPKKHLSGKRKEVLSKYGITKPYVLHVGSAYPHKNLEALVQSLVYLEKKYKLVLVGRRDIFHERIIKIAKAIGVFERIINTDFVPNEELVILYKEAEAFVFPSFSEGFGLPGLEAMASGCPLFCSSIAVFKEVYGDAAVYFNPKEPKSIAEKIGRAIKSGGSRSNLIKKGFEQVEKYSWEKMAEKTLDVYEDLGSKT